MTGCVTITFGLRKSLQITSSTPATTKRQIHAIWHYQPQPLRLMTIVPMHYWRSQVMQMPHSQSNVECNLAFQMPIDRFGRSALEGRDQVPTGLEAHHHSQ